MRGLLAEGVKQVRKITTTRMLKAFRLGERPVASSMAPGCRFLRNKRTSSAIDHHPVNSITRTMT